MNQMKNTTQGVLLALLGATLFSSKAIMVKLSYQIEVDTLTLLVMRMGFALPFYLLIALRESRKPNLQKIETKDWFILFFIGLVGYYLASLFDFIGLQYISAGLERLILFLYPTITLLLSALIFKRKLRRNQVVAIVVAYIGIFISFWDKIFVPQGELFWLGALFIFGSALTYSFYLVGSESIIPKFGVVKFTAYCMVISCLIMMFHFAVSDAPSILSHSWHVYALGFAIAMFNTLIPSFIISAAISKIGSAKTSALSSIGPVFVIVTAAIFLGESITAPKVIGTLVVIVGVWLASRKG